MKITTAQRNLALTGGATVKRVESIATVLRGWALLPKGGRGPYAPNASAEEIALFMIAVAGADRIADAANVATLLHGLVTQDGASLLDILAAAIGCSEEAATIRHVRVLPTVPMAEITYRKDGQPDTVTKCFPPSAWSTHGFKPEAQGQGYVGPIGHIGGAALMQMSLDFSSVDDAA